MIFQFYHLMQSSPKDALPRLAEKAFASEQLMIILTSNVKEWNDHLWSYKPEAFLPHGCDLDGDPLVDPIWITSQAHRPIEADLLLVCDDMDVPLEFAQGFEKCLYLFDGRNDASLAKARALWKSLEGTERHYFQQTAKGGWEKKEV